ncbi:MAG: DUF418 domain-containing protein [Rhodanobacter sp.]
MSASKTATPGAVHAPDQIAGPIKPKQRIQALDVIRGVAILGILAVNADGFAAPISASLKPAMWFFPDQGATAISYWIMDAIFHDKFLAMFSMLFGVSLFLVGGEVSDKQRSRILARRLFVLFLFGMLHGFGIWWGDILSLYAATGAIMFFCRSWQSKTLMTLGVIFYAGVNLMNLPMAELFVHGELVANAVPSPAGLAHLAAYKAQIAQTLVEAKGSWLGAYSVNAQSYLRVLSGYPRLLLPTLGLMMVGLSLFKSGFLSAKSSTRMYAIVASCAAPAFALAAWLCWQQDITQTPLLGTEQILVLLAPIIVLGYASVIIFALKAGRSRWLAPFAATGRMAFTNYLTQSLIMTTIFYGGRGALMGQIDRPGLWLIVIGIWALQLTWSHFWLARFDMGPFEWVWRCLTYGYRVPFLRARQIAAR